jgi:succinyl-CoA synthetase alpha subunit
MAILLNDKSRVVIQGITGKYSRQQLGMMQAAGTPIVAGVSMGAAGTQVDGIPVFDTVADAVAATRANASLLYVPAMGLKDAIIENVDAGIGTIVAAAEHAPVHDTMIAAAYARRRNAWLVGPNSLGMVVPGYGMLGSYSLEYARPGPVGIISRSGSVSVSASRLIAGQGLGQSACIHIGGDYICGRNPGEYVEAFENDPATEIIVYCGEVGGGKEYDLLRYKGAKPIVALIVGRAAQREKRLGHAGALVLSDSDTADAKRDALRAAGVHIADSITQLAEICGRLAGAGASAPRVLSGA